MQHHSKTYEDVFSVDKTILKNPLKIEKISIQGMSLEEYTSLFQNFLTCFYSSLFLDCVRLSWLRRSFSYYGKKTILPMQKNSRNLNSAFVKYLRRFVGKDIQVLTRSTFFSKLESYFNELIPGFMDGDPFDNPDYYRFPFKNISIEYLMVVHQLDERVALLKKADEDKMTYAEFLDYVINYVSVENDLLQRGRYEMRHNQDRHFPFCVKDTDKHLQAKRGKKRT